MQTVLGNILCLCLLYTEISLHSKILLVTEEEK